MKRTFARIMPLIILGCTVLLAVGCSAAPAKLTLVQGKPEIDAALKAYATGWSKANKIEVIVKSVGRKLGYGSWYSTQGRSGRRRHARYLRH